MERSSHQRRLRPRLLPGLAACAFLLALACALPGSRAERTRLGLIGLDARILNGCLGVPADIHSDDHDEYQPFEWQLAVSPDGLEPYDEWLERMRLRYRGFRPELLGRRGFVGTYGYCKLIFNLRERRIRDVEAEGRNGAGLRWHSGCMLIARRCLPKDEPDKRAWLGELYVSLRGRNPLAKPSP